MQIYIQMKAAGKRRPVLNDVPYELSDEVKTLRDFLTALVELEVKRYEQKGTGVQVIPFLTKEDVEEQAAAGKVGFGQIYSEQKADPAKAVENALQCYEDGLVRVFRGDRELAGLDTPVCLEEGERFTLIRLTFLAGRLW